MWPECGTLYESLAPVFKEIERDAVYRAQINNRKMRYRRWTYEQLGRQCDCLDCDVSEEDWKHDGRVRRLICGSEAREQLLEDFGLVWKADMADHEGLLFTADPLTAVDWTVARISTRAARDGRHLSALCRWAVTRNPTNRPEFQRYDKYAKKLANNGSKLVDLRNVSLLALMKGQDEDGGEAA